MIELKPCPFCGSIPEVIDIYDFDPYVLPHQYFVGCKNQNCPKDSVSTKLYKYKKCAVHAWNRGNIQVVEDVGY